MSDVAGVPAVREAGRAGCSTSRVAPDFATSHMIYLSYAEPGDRGSALALARGTLDGATLAGCRR